MNEYVLLSETGDMKSFNTNMSTRSTNKLNGEKKDFLINGAEPLDIQLGKNIPHPFLST